MPTGRTRFIGRLMKNSDVPPAFYLPLCVGLLSLCVSPLRSLLLLLLPLPPSSLLPLLLPPLLTSGFHSHRSLSPFLSLSLAPVLYAPDSRHRFILER